MSERFMVDDAGTLIDVQTRDMFDIVEEVCPLLNILAEENEQLKTKNNAYIQDIEVYKEENTHLKLENEELKDFAQHNYSETKKIINNLQKENEQLKKQLESEHTMLDNAILLERTRMGQSALKQYKEAIQ